MFVLELERAGGAGTPITGVKAIGGGHGHGIGMCQVGAVGMSEAGIDYKKILEHYYPQSHVKRLY
jgi:stage II sporulation protein D